MKPKTISNERMAHLISLLGIGSGLSNFPTVEDGCWEDRADILMLIHEAQLHVDWPATNKATRRDGELGRFFHKTRVHFQDMDNLITRDLTEEEKKEMREKLEETSPGKGDWIMANSGGLVTGVRYKKKMEKTPKDGRVNKKIYVYRFIPQSIYAKLGLQFPFGTFTMPQNLYFDRKTIHKFRQEIRRAFDVPPGNIVTCAFCGKPFLSERRQKGKYSCSDARCRKRKTRQKVKFLSFPSRSYLPGAGVSRGPS